MENNLTDNVYKPVNKDPTTYLEETAETEVKNLPLEDPKATHPSF